MVDSLVGKERERLLLLLFFSLFFMACLYESGFYWAEHEARHLPFAVYALCEQAW